MMLCRNINYICPILILKVIMESEGFLLNSQNFPYHETMSGHCQQNSMYRVKWTNADSSWTQWRCTKWAHNYPTLQNSISVNEPNCYLFVCCSIITLCASTSNRDHQVSVRPVCCEVLYPSRVVHVICGTIWLGLKNKGKSTTLFDGDQNLVMGWREWREMKGRQHCGIKKRLCIIWLILSIF